MSKSAPDALDLPKPKLVEADENGRVNSLDLLNGGNVSVCYDMRANDLIHLNWPLAGSAYPELEPQDGSDEGCIYFYIPPAYIALWLDSLALFTYTVTRDGEEQTSVQGQAHISLPSNLPQVQILGAIDDKLDLSLLCCKDPVLYLPSWAFAGTLQTIRCYISGIRPDDSKFGFYLYEHEPVTEEDVRNGWRRILPRSVLQQFKHNSELYVFCTVRFSAATPYRGFPGKVFTLFTEPHLEMDAPTVVQAVECSPGGCLLNPRNATDGATLRVAYDHACPGDYVCAHWKGTAGPGTPYLACQEIGADGFIDFAVPASAISANFKQTVSVSYTVLREGQTWFSPSRDIHILNISDLPKPQIPEATGTTLDLNTFCADPGILVSPWWFIGVVDPRWLWVTGTLEDGTPYSLEVIQGESGPITGVSVILPRRELQKLVDCSPVYVHFAVNFNGQVHKASAEEFPVLALKLVQEDLVLPAPTVQEAAGDQLTIWDGRDGVTVRVAYERISAGHEIRVCLESSDDCCWSPVSKPGSSDLGYVGFDIPREAVIRGAGKTNLISYTVTSACKDALSKKLALKISVPTRLPTPMVPEATPPATQLGVLDVRVFIGDAHITVNDERFDEAWWFALVGQCGWLECIGTKEDGSSYTIKVMSAELITLADVNNGLTRVLARSDLIKFRDKTPLTIFFKVSADGSSVADEAIVFPELKLTFRSYYRDLTDFDNQSLGKWAIGAGAPDARDISFEPQGTGYAVKNYTYSANNVGPILWRVFDDLEEDRTYRFSVRVRRFNYANPTPKLSLRENGQDRTSVVELISPQDWQSLSFTFKASSAPVRLEIYSHELDRGKTGNDYLMDDFLVEEI